MRPEGTVIQLCMEQHILDGSITADTHFKGRSSGQCGV